MKNGKSIWHCARISDENAEIPLYAEPKEYRLAFNYLTIQPASGFTNLLEYGEKIGRTWNGMASYAHFAGVFKEGDLLYIDDAAPDQERENEYGYGYTANALITSVREQNRMIRLVISNQ